MKRTVCLEAWPFVHLITGTAVKISNAFGSELGRHERQLEVERALIWAHWQLGRDRGRLQRRGGHRQSCESVTKERASEIEAETRHDIMALTKAMAEAAGEAGWASISGPLPTTSWTQPWASNCETASFCYENNSVTSSLSVQMWLSGNETP